MRCMSLSKSSRVSTSAVSNVKRTPFRSSGGYRFQSVSLCAGDIRWSLLVASREPSKMEPRNVFDDRTSTIGQSPANDKKEFIRSPESHVLHRAATTTDRATNHMPPTPTRTPTHRPTERRAPQRPIEHRRRQHGRIDNRCLGPPKHGRAPTSPPDPSVVSRNHSLALLNRLSSTPPPGHPPKPTPTPAYFAQPNVRGRVLAAMPRICRQRRC